MWNFSSTTPTLPVLGLNIAIDGAAPVTWVRCSAGVIWPGKTGEAFEAAGSAASFSEPVR